MDGSETKDKFPQNSPQNSPRNSPKKSKSLRSAFIYIYLLLFTAQSPATLNEVPVLKSVSKISEIEIKTLEALILHEIHKEHELGLAIMAEILEREPSPESLYHYARMALAAGLQIEYRNKMLAVLNHQKPSSYKEYALKHLVQNPQTLEVEDIAYIDPWLKSSKESLTPAPGFYFLQGKFYHQSGFLKKATESLALVEPDSSLSLEASFLKGVLEYKLGDLDKAIDELENVMDLTKKDTKNNLRSTAALTLGRLHFQKADYKKSFENFKKVDRGNALWLEAMSEQAWAQIMIRDYEGAAGNMYSLHTDYFKNVYSPESFLIRSVGYLNLCQYGDGMRVLVELGKKYFPIKEKLDKFMLSQDQDSFVLYDKLKLWTKNPSRQEIEGIPAPLLVQSGRDPQFLSLQKKINQREDEINQFNKMFLELIESERKAIKKENETLKSLHRQARSHLKTVRSNTQRSLNNEINQLKKKASDALQSRFRKLYEQLQSTIDNHEILYYEVYSGAGEHLRYQTAGGKPGQAERPQLIGDPSKNLIWKFKGEIWEDEIGFYRSSLKSVCPDDSNEKNPIVANGP